MGEFFLVVEFKNPGFITATVYTICIMDTVKLSDDKTGKSS